MKNRNDLSLLQHCASFRDIPLTVYTPPPHWAEHGNRADVELGGRIFPNRMAAGHVELDLDVWLCLPMFRHGNKEYSNNDVVRSFADTMDGAHHDKSVDPNIEEFFRHQGRAFGSIGTFDLMSSLVLELGFTVRVLGEKVLEALRFDSPNAGVLSK